MRPFHHFGLFFTIYIVVTFSLTACGSNASEPAPVIEGTDFLPKQTTTSETIDLW
jgi:hypothetical protein